MEKQKLPLSRVYQLLEPGPVVLLTTAAGSQTNVMTLSWHTMMEFEPPLVGCVISAANYSFELLAAARECVINVPPVELARAVVRVGNTSGRTVDKFRKFGLTPVPAARVRPPLIAECFANLECRIADGHWVKRYNFFVLEVVQAWISPHAASARTLHHRGHGVFAVDGEILRLPSRKI